MEDYAGLSPPTPPSSLLLVSALSLLPVPSIIPTTQSAPPAIPCAQDRSTEAPAATKSKPKVKPQQKMPEAGPSTKPAQAKEPAVKPNTTVASGASKGEKKVGDSIEARPKKTRVVSAKYIDNSDEGMVKLQLKSQPPAKSKSQPQAVTDLIQRPRSQTPIDDLLADAKPNPQIRGVATTYIKYIGQMPARRFNCSQGNF